MSISLISLENGVECYLFCSKRTKVNFVLDSILKYGSCYYLVKPILKEELKRMSIHAFKQRLSRRYEAPRETNKDKKERMVWTPEMKRIFHECYLDLDTRGGMNHFPNLKLH